MQKRIQIKINQQKVVKQKKSPNHSVDEEIEVATIESVDDASDDAAANLRDQITWILRIKYFMSQQILKQINNCSLNSVSAIRKDHNSKEV